MVTVILLYHTTRMWIISRPLSSKKKRSGVQTLLLKVPLFFSPGYLVIEVHATGRMTEAVLSPGLCLFLNSGCHFFFSGTQTSIESLSNS